MSVTTDILIEDIMKDNYNLNNNNCDICKKAVLVNQRNNVYYCKKCGLISLMILIWILYV